MKSPPRKVRGRPWRPGKSGNPKGRPPDIPLEVKAAAQTHSAEAMAVLVKWMGSSNPRASLMACELTIERAFGPPPKAVEVAGTDDLAAMAREGLVAELAATLAKFGIDPGGVEG
ncbi:MAG TPA: hypothetical protein VGJ20_43360 [Xanthobacteraceae bacterium]|jgi:hypothetical protein